MNKQAFLTRLREGLSGLPQDDIAEHLTFYGEMIDDRIEDGLSEEAAVAEIGPADRIVDQIMAEIPITKLVRERVKPKRRLQAWEIILLVLGSPIWLSLLIAAFAIVLSLYIVIWAVIVSFWAADLALAAASLGGLMAANLLIFRGEVTQGLLMLSAAFVLAGLAIFLFFGCRAMSRTALVLKVKLTSIIKSMFLRKENSK